MSNALFDILLYKLHGNSICELRKFCIETIILGDSVLGSFEALMYEIQHKFLKEHYFNDKISY